MYLAETVNGGDSGGDKDGRSGEVRFGEGVSRTVCRLSDKGFTRFGQLVHSCCGIKMPPQKKSMMEARLRKRLRVLSLEDFEDYADYLFSERGQRDELVHFLDVMTTNKTDFFREPAHYDYLLATALPRLLHTYGAGNTRKLRVWSAGCSTGEEPYTLAMVLSEFAGENPAFDFSILATDISTRVLETGRVGVYDESKIAAIPAALKHKYLLRSKDPTRRVVRIAPELRAKVTFRRLNFMDENFGIREPIDIVFCRNVIIYFDRPTQQMLLEHLVGHLFPGRYLFMGHSETLNGMNLPLSQVAPSVYRKN